jgi:hypothetical protein
MVDLTTKSDNKNNMNMVKRETGEIHLTKEMLSLFTNNGKVKGPETTTNAFNNFL